MAARLPAAAAVWLPETLEVVALPEKPVGLVVAQLGRGVLAPAGCLAEAAESPVAAAEASPAMVAGWEEAGRPAVVEWVNRAAGPTLVTDPTRSATS